MVRMGSLIDQLILARLEIPRIRNGHTIAFKHLVDASPTAALWTIIPSDIRIVELELQISFLFLLL